MPNSHWSRQRKYQTIWFNFLKYKMSDAVFDTEQVLSKCSGPFSPPFLLCSLLFLPFPSVSITTLLYMTNRQKIG